MSDADPLTPRVEPTAGERLLLPWRRAPFPAPWPSWFGRQAPLHLEIGFGDGRFTAARAQREPDHDFVGIEISGVSVRRALRRLQRDRVPNVRIVKAPAQAAVRQLFAPASLASVTVNFPDPWPKERHERHRLLRIPFLGVLAERLEPQGEVRLATDHEDYLAFAEAQAQESGWYRAERRAAPAETFQTKYALKWRDQGKPLHYVAFVRSEAPAPTVPPIARPARMPHALLHGALPSDPDFAKEVVPYQDGHVVLHEAVRALGGDRFAARILVRVTVDEPDLVQQMLVAVQRREGDEHIVRLESFGDPIITPTVRGAVHAVTEWLLRSGDWTVAARNY